MTPELIAAYVVDRAGWGAGPWDGEPDRVDFRHAGFACLLLRGAWHGAWCGYVGVPTTHPDYGRDYNDVLVECHGGLTYGQKCDGSHICHIAAPGEPDDLWWLGFDCGHCWDLSPGFEARLGVLGGFNEQRTYRDEQRTYRDVDYVRREVEQLADQLAVRQAA